MLLTLPPNLSSSRAHSGVLDHFSGTGRFLQVAATALAAEPPADAAAEARKKATAALAAQRGACEKASTLALAARAMMPFEPDLFGTNLPPPKPGTINLLQNDARANDLLLRLEVNYGYERRTPSDEFLVAI